MFRGGGNNTIQGKEKEKYSKYQARTLSSCHGYILIFQPNHIKVLYKFNREGWLPHSHKVRRHCKCVVDHFLSSGSVITIYQFKYSSQGLQRLLPLIVILIIMPFLIIINHCKNSGNSKLQSATVSKWGDGTEAGCQSVIAILVRDKVRNVKKSQLKVLQGDFNARRKNLCYTYCPLKNTYTVKPF